MLVRDVMVSDVTMISADTTVDAVAQIMSDLDIGALVVGREGGEPAGILSDRDILIRVVASQLDPRATPVGRVMSESLYCCGEESDVEEVLREMERHQIRRMPVIDREGRLVGLVTLGDIRRAQLRQAAGDKPRQG